LPIIEGVPGDALLISSFDINALWEQYWPGLLAVSSVLLAAGTTVHIVLHKRESRAAAAWTGLVWLVPFLGFGLYLLIGVNRIHRRARQLTRGGLDIVSGWRPAAEPQPSQGNMRALAALVARLTGLPLTGGNALRVLSAAEAFEAMIRAVETATESVYLCTYIFGNDAAGQRMVAALAAACQRGIRVRVLVDGMGLLYSFPTIRRHLRQQGIPHARFLYSWAPWRMPYMNMRNHRKILVVDRRLGFTGGMNLRAGYLLTPPTTHDLHFQVSGPVVGHLLHSIATDWYFSTGELLDDAYRGPAVAGEVLARGISAGPDADFEKRRLTLLAAIGRAEREIRIMTPYFVPDQSLQMALYLARLRGVRVRILLPERNNLRIVHWASLHVVPWLVDKGCEVSLGVGPFEHGKLMTVDGCWSMVGSGNWDARSLRLNFEFDMECYGEQLAAELNHCFDMREANARQLDHELLAHWPVLRRVGHALAHMLEPYL
jgi:cardiolipin synthase A/B